MELVQPMSHSLVARRRQPARYAIGVTGPESEPDASRQPLIWLYDAVSEVV
jgi:hypothetical protein